VSRLASCLPAVRTAAPALATTILFSCLVSLSPAEAQPRERRNFYGMHNLMDGGAAIPEGMNWTRHLVGDGGYVFDWVRGDYGKWVVEAMDRGLIPCLRLQECNGGCTPDPGYQETVANVIREHLEQYRPEYLTRIIYIQPWNEPGDPRDYVSPEDFADYLVAAYAGLRRADVNDVIRVMTPGQNGAEWWRRAIRHNPGVCQAFDVWATHPYPESYPPHYNHHDGIPFINQVKTIDSYLLDLDAVADECETQGSPRRGFPVMITETAYGDHLGIAYEGYPKTTRGEACTVEGPCDFALASQYNVAAFGELWRKWPEIVAVHPFILNNWAWDPFAFVSKASGSRADLPVPAWCPPEDPVAGVTWPPGYSPGARRCGLPTAPYPQYKALLDLPKPPPASLEPYRGPVGSIRGLVRRADTGEPVKHATVFTDGRAFGGPTLFDGQYVVHDVPIGSYTLSVEKVGYGPASAPIAVREGQTTIVDFDLPYRGKVSRGIYFQNQGTCSGCNLFAPFLAQTFTAPPDVGFIKFAAAMPNVGDVTLRFSIREGGPTGPRIGPSVTAYLEWGGEMIGAEWPGDGVPVEPGGSYALRIEREDAQGVYLYATDANPYSDGMAYTATTAHPGWDLFATIRGASVAVDTAVGTVTGVVESPMGQPLVGARVTAEPGAHTTVSAADGRYVLGALPEGLYTLSATLAGYLPQSVGGVEVFRSQTTVVDLVLEADVSQGRLEGSVRDQDGQPLAGAIVRVLPGGPLTATDGGGHYSFEDLSPGTYSVSASLDGYAEREETAVVDGGETTRLDIVLTALPPPPPPASLIANGDFSQGLTGWATWRERGELNPTVDGGGRLQLSAVGHNGGVYQTFSTGGAGSEITIDGLWASSPTAPQAHWAEVLVINGPRIPVDGQDLSAGQSDVVLVYKNDTWATPAGWSGDMRSTSPVQATGSFMAAADTATIVLKSGNLPGTSSGTLFDDIVVSGSAAPPPPDSRGSKLTIHTGFGGPLSMQFVERARPGLLKILDSFSGAAEVKRLSPETQIIGRAYLASQPMDGDPVQRAREWWDRTRNLVLDNPAVDYWEGYNEPIIQTVELMGWYAQFEAERVRLLASEGSKACIGNFSVGNPDLALWPAFYPAIDAALAHGGILGLHEYGTPMQQLFDEAAGEGWLAGRYRKVYRQHLIPSGRPIRLAITECGVDVIPPVGWKNHFTEDEYLAQLQWYDRLIREDDYVIGATIFALEIPGWWSFDIAPIVDRLAEYVAAEAPTP
jgi:hypothetical protein